MIPDMQLALRMLDGVRVNGVQIELYAATRIRSGVVVIHHVTAINPESRGGDWAASWSACRAKPRARCNFSSTGLKAAADAVAALTDRYPSNIHIKPI